MLIFQLSLELFNDFIYTLVITSTDNCQVPKAPSTPATTSKQCSTSSKQHSTSSKESFDLWHLTVLLRHCCWCERSFSQKVNEVCDFNHNNAVLTYSKYPLVLPDKFVWEIRCLSKVPNLKWSWFQSKMDNFGTSWYNCVLVLNVVSKICRHIDLLDFSGSWNEHQM